MSPTHLEVWHTMLLALCVIGLYLGWFTDALSMPIWGAGGEMLHISAGDGGDEEGGDENDSRGKLEGRRREKASSAMKFACDILGAPGKQDAARSVWCVGKPVVTAMAKQMKQMQSTTNTIAYYAGFVPGKYDFVLQKVWTIMRSPEDLKYMGFKGMGGGVGLGTPTESEVLRDDTEVQAANKLFDLVFHTVRCRCMNINRHKYICPGIFALLIDGTEESKQLGLRLAKEVWTVLDEMDRMANLYPAVQAVVSAIPWASEVFNRELLMMLACHDFMYLSPPALHMVKTLYSGFGQTAIVESANKTIRDVSGKTGGGGTASRVTRYERPHIAGVMKDAPQNTLGGVCRRCW